MKTVSRSRTKSKLGKGGLPDIAGYKAMIRLPLHTGTSFERFPNIR